MTNPLDVVKTRLQTQEIKPSCKKLLELFEMGTHDKQGASQLKEQAQNMQGCSKGPNGCNVYGSHECEFALKKVRYNDFLTTIRLIY